MSDAQPGSAQKAYGYYKRYKKYREVYERIKAVVDDDTRSGALLKEAIKLSLDIGSKLLGRNLADHPYFAYHKVHIEILVKALEATSTLEHAQESWQSAAAGAVHARELAGQCEGYANRRRELVFYYAWRLAGSLAMLRDNRVDPGKVAGQFKETGNTPQSLQADTDRLVEDWRERWHELANDALSLLLMAQVQARSVQQVMDEYDRRKKKLETDKSVFSFLASKRLEEDDQWRQYDLATANRGERDARAALADPVKVARDALAQADTTALQISRCAEIAMGDDIYGRPEQAAQDLSANNR